MNLSRKEEKNRGKFTCKNQILMAQFLKPKILVP